MFCLADFHSAMDIVGENTESGCVYMSIRRANLVSCVVGACEVCCCTATTEWCDTRFRHSAYAWKADALAHASGTHYPVLVLYILDCSLLPLSRGIHLIYQELQNGSCLSFCRWRYHLPRGFCSRSSPLSSGSLGPPERIRIATSESLSGSPELRMSLCSAPPKY